LKLLGILGRKAGMPKAKLTNLKLATTKKRRKKK
jgi:hypothetical protein